jgi:transposase
MHAIPFEVRKAIVRCYQKHKDVKYVCSLFEVSKSSVMLFVRKERQGEPLEPAKKTQPLRFTKEQRESIVLWAIRPPSKLATVSSLVARFKRQYRTNISHRTVRRILKAANLSYKRLYVKIKRSSKQKRQRPSFRKQMAVVKDNLKHTGVNDQVKFGTAHGPRILSLDETRWMVAWFNPPSSVLVSSRRKAQGCTQEASPLP